MKVQLHHIPNVTSQNKCHTSHRSNPEWEKLLWFIPDNKTDAKHPKINYIRPHCLLLISYIHIYKQSNSEWQLRHDRINSWHSTALTSSLNIQPQNYRVFKERKINWAFINSAIRRCVLRKVFQEVSENPGAFICKGFADMIKVLCFQKTYCLDCLIHENEGFISSLSNTGVRIHKINRYVQSSKQRCW